MFAIGDYVQRKDGTGIVMKVVSIEGDEVVCARLKKKETFRLRADELEKIKHRSIISNF